METRLKILHLATQDKGGGGGGFDAAYRLHCNMRNAGVDSMMAVLNKRSDDATVLDFSLCLSTMDRLRWISKSMLARIARRFYQPSPYFFVGKGNFFSSEALVKALPFKPDIIIAHWISDFISADMLGRLEEATGAPLLWYMMDMAPLTGGCHYAFGCDGYTRQCGQCPQIHKGRSAHDISHRQLHRKIAGLGTSNMTAVVPTSWLAIQAKASTLFSNMKIRQIMLGIDAETFKPVLQDDARLALGLPKGRKIIFFGAQNVSEERKGLHFLVSALKSLHGDLANNPQLRENILIVTAGSWDGSQPLELPFEHHHLGFLKGDVALASAYQAADIFANASIEDSGPMMVNESILCGTPVISFDMGVARDLVHSGRTGYRARLKDAGDFACGFAELLQMNDDAMRAMREECRIVGLRSCHPDVQVRAFVELCREKLAETAVKLRETNEKIH